MNHWKGNEGDIIISWGYIFHPWCQSTHHLNLLKWVGHLINLHSSLFLVGLGHITQNTLPNFFQHNNHIHELNAKNGHFFPPPVSSPIARAVPALWSCVWIRRIWWDNGNLGVSSVGCWDDVVVSPNRRRGLERTSVWSLDIDLCDHTSKGKIFFDLGMIVVLDEFLQNPF